MAALLIGGVVLGVDKYRKHKDDKKAKAAQTDAQLRAEQDAQHREAYFHDSKATMAAQERSQRRGSDSSLASWEGGGRDQHEPPPMYDGPPPSQNNHAGYGGPPPAGSSTMYPPPGQGQHGYQQSQLGYAPPPGQYGAPASYGVQPPAQDGKGKGKKLWKKIAG